MRITIAIQNCLHDPPPVVFSAAPIDNLLFSDRALLSDDVLLSEREAKIR